jgi:NADPH:quinone reductase-like Zn-dependent oxidoreductase
VSSYKLLNLLIIQLDSYERSNLMEAIRIHVRGGPSLLRYEEAPRPILEPGDALVRVYASGITPTELTWDETYETCDGADRLPSIPGHELSGVVEALENEAGADVRVGDAVYGLTSFCRDGTDAEYVAVRAADLAPKPQTIDYAQAAAVPLSSLTAWQALFDHANLRAGQRILIHGAAGGVGTFTVQLAHWKGAYVIGTASEKNFDFLRRLGADELIDYKKVLFEEATSDIDVVIDAIGGETRQRSWSVMKPDGILISLVGPVSQEKAAQTGARAVFFIVTPSRHQLIKIAELIDSGTLIPIISATFPLDKAKEAFAQGLRGGNRGKLVLRVVH